jgi:hypothetical protein
MQNMKTIVLFCAALISLNTYSCKYGFFAENQFINDFDLKSVDEARNDAMSTVTEIKSIYTPIFKQQGKHLEIEIEWDEMNINAYATRDMADNPIIRVTGGMLRNEIITKDGIALVLCHELGHFLGGAPKQLRGRSQKKSWSSAEGQADYYATAVCMKKYFKKYPADISTHKSGTQINTEINKICNNEICKRISYASLNIAQIYKKIDYYGNDLSLTNRDQTEVYQTIYRHPNPQCRLDTMINGLQCPNSEKINFNSSDPRQSTCKTKTYKRPRCWFAPATDLFDF